MIQKPFIIAVIGPTASGKSELAVQLAKKYHGEIISADSRQVYRGMDIGTGKIEGKWQGNKYVYKSIPHYGIDIASPRSQYSVAKFQSYAKKVIAEILARKKVPIICGGTGHWVDAVLFDQNLPTVKPNMELRKKLEKLSTTQLFAKLKKLDPRRAENIDAKNPRRLIRALEIVTSTGKPIPPLTPPILGGGATLSSPNTGGATPDTEEAALSSPSLGEARRGIKYNVLWLGITHEKTILDKKIDKRLDGWLKSGMVKEVKNLHANGLSWKRLESFGLEYKFVAQFLQKKISTDEMKVLTATAIKQYAKRQMTWFKRNKDIHWVKNFSEASKLIPKI